MTFQPAQAGSQDAWQPFSVQLPFHSQDASSKPFHFVCVNIQPPPVSSEPDDDLYREIESIRLSSSLHHQTPGPLALKDSVTMFQSHISPARTLFLQCSHFRISAPLVPRSKTYCHGNKHKSKQEEQKINLLNPKFPRASLFFLPAKPPYRNDNTCLFALKPSHSN